MDKGLSVIIGGFITIILALVLFGSLASQNASIQTLDTVTNDLATLTNTTCTKVTNGAGCINAITSVVNSTVTYSVGNYTLCKSANDKYDGVKLAANTLFATTDANVTYTESTTCMYVTDGTSRTLTNIILIFFAIAILIAGVYYLKQSGMLDMF